MPKKKSYDELYAEVSCVSCGAKRMKLRYTLKHPSTGLCLKCSSLRSLSKIKNFTANKNWKSGEDHHNWVPPINCIDCGKSIKAVGERRLNQKRCSECYHKSMKMENHPSWNGKRICKTCNGYKQKHSSTECKKCYDARMDKMIPYCKVCNNKVTKGSCKSGICQKCLKGEFSPKWNPNLDPQERGMFRTKNPAYSVWRKQVFQRDSFSCQKCGDNKGGNLCSHHIENFAENKGKRFDVDNGITLCEPCHIGFHKQYGWKGNNANQLNEYLGLVIQLTA